jgi:spermidine/putrescine transport system permease protein
MTFPVKVYSMVRFSVSPEVNAASTLLMGLTVVVAAMAIWLGGARATSMALAGERGGR